MILRMNSNFEWLSSTYVSLIQCKIGWYYKDKNVRHRRDTKSFERRTSWFSRWCCGLRWWVERQKNFWFLGIKFALMMWQILGHLVYRWSCKLGLFKYLHRQKLAKKMNQRLYPSKIKPTSGDKRIPFVLTI